MSASILYNVRKKWEGFVKPSEATPSKTLSVSWLDKMPSNKSMRDVLVVFDKGQSPGKVIREALSKALVPYYPMAGVFTFSEEGELQVVCNADGVWFVDAIADCTLDQLGFLTHTPVLMTNQDHHKLLIPNEGFPPVITDPTDRMLFMQVTEFKCGGFILGLKSNHAIWDGIGSAQFVKAVADLTKNGGELQQLNPQPVWHRDLLPIPDLGSLPKGTQPPAKDTPEIIPSIFQLSSSLITKLKTHVSHKLNQSCTSFEVVTAKIWQSRARAMHADHPHVNLHLHIAMNVRHILKQVIPPGYYGNCFHLATLSMERSRLVSEELHEVVKMIKDAKERLPVDYFEWLKGNVKVDPGSFGSSYESLGVTDWTRLGYFEADFGWGCPKNFFSFLCQDQKFASCFILRGPAGQDGLSLVAQCLGNEELDHFYDELVSLKFMEIDGACMKESN